MNGFAWWIIPAKVAIGWNRRWIGGEIGLPCGYVHVLRIWKLTLLWKEEYPGAFWCRPCKKWAAPKKPCVHVLREYSGND